MPLLPTHLRCEYLTEPLAIDNSHPRLSWTIECSDPARHALAQTAYQILVTLRPTFPEILRPEQIYGGVGLHTLFPAPGEVYGFVDH